MIESEMMAHNTLTEGTLLKGLPVVRLDDDFLEHLKEQSIGDSVEFDEFVLEYQDWEKEATR